MFAASPAHRPSLQERRTFPWRRRARHFIGKTASYSDDAGELLRSLPKDALLKINVFDGSDLSHETTFRVAGLDIVRKKIGTACKWPPEEKLMSGKR